MGRSRATFRDLLRDMEQQWQSFRRALRKQYQEDFDQLFEDARRFADAAGNQNTAHPDDAVFFSILLALQSKYRRLENRVQELEQEEKG